MPPHAFPLKSRDTVTYISLRVRQSVVTIVGEELSLLPEHCQCGIMHLNFFRTALSLFFFSFTEI